MLAALGEVARLRMEELFISRIGKCLCLQADESMMGGKRKYNRGRRQCLTQRWFMCVVEICERTGKVLHIFFERIPGPGTGYR